MPEIPTKTGRSIGLNHVMMDSLWHYCFDDYSRIARTVLNRSLLFDMVANRRLYESDTTMIRTARTAV